MDERYRLIYRGEILDGQHRAVVKRRLTELLKLGDAQVEKLFAGQPVVLKRDVDRDTAARYQALFKKAGGRLRVTAEAAAGASGVPDTAAPRVASAAPADAAVSATETQVASVRTPEFEVQSTWFPPPAEPRGEIEAPEYSLAAVGSDLSEGRDEPPPRVPDADFEIAEVGADLLTDRVEVPVADLGPLNFEVAEVGADIGPRPPPSDARAPDVSHLAIVEP